MSHQNKEIVLICMAAGWLLSLCIVFISGMWTQMKSENKKSRIKK